jgi:PST family polysaccharide transporter
MAKRGRGSLARNAAVLYCAHATGVVLSLVSIPYLARVLRPDGWGVVVFAQAFAGLLTLLLEYGFHLSATREIARHRDDEVVVARIVAEVQSARLILLAAATAIVAVAYAAIPLFREHPAHLVFAWLIAASQGFSAYWFYQGVERPTYPALGEALSKGVATALLLVWVRDPGDGAVAMAIYGSAAFVWSTSSNALIYLTVPAVRPSPRAGARMLIRTANLFAFRAASGSYVAANSFILGWMASPPVVAYYGGAERLIRGALNGITPATQAIYPRVSQLMITDHRGASRILGVSLLCIGGMGTAIGVGAFISAPWLVELFLGSGYEAAVPVLRAMSVVAPIVAASTVLGLQWALPAGLERPYFRLVVGGALLNVALAVLLIPRFGAMGMAAAVIASESTVLAGLAALAWQHGRETWRTAIDVVAGSRWRTASPAAAAPPVVADGAGPGDVVQSEPTHEAGSP